MIYDDFESVPGNDYIWWLIPVRMARVWGTVDFTEATTTNRDGPYIFMWT